MALLLLQCSNLAEFKQVDFSDPFEMIHKFITMLEQVRLRQFERFYLPGCVEDVQLVVCLSAIFCIKDLVSNLPYLGPLAFDTLSGHYGSLKRLTLSGCSSAMGDMA